MFDAFIFRFLYLQVRYWYLLGVVHLPLKQKHRHRSVANIKKKQQRPKLMCSGNKAKAIFIYCKCYIHWILCKSNEQKRESERDRERKRRAKRALRLSTLMRTRFFYWMMERPTNKQIKWIGFFSSSVASFMCIEIEMKPQPASQSTNQPTKNRTSSNLTTKMKNKLPGEKKEKKTVANILYTLITLGIVAKV